MYKKRIFLLSCIILSLLCMHLLALNVKPLQEKDSLLVDADFIQSMFRYGLGLGVPFGVISLGYEKSIGKDFSVLLETGLINTYEYIGGFGLGATGHLYSTVSLRKYYNIKRRVKKETNTHNNAFSYFGPMVYFFSKSFGNYGASTSYSKYSDITFPMCWGFQRSLSKKILLDLTIGFGPAYVFNSGFAKDVGSIQLSGLTRLIFFLYK